MDAATRRRVCELIAGIISSDGHLDPSELVFMLRTFKAFGIATGQEDEAVSPAIAKHDAVASMRALPAEVREETLQLLIQSAAADGKVVPAERAYLSAVAEAAEVPEADLERRIDAALHHA
ncbi:MAG: TerB family tellurite resistance protein [Myxococcota bacterium]